MIHTETEQIEQGVTDALRAVLAETRERCIRKAVADFETELRATVGRVGMEVSRYFTIERTGQQITIAIKDLR